MYMFVAAIFLIGLLFVHSTVALCPSTASQVLGANPQDSFTTAEGNDFLILSSVAGTKVGEYLFVVANGLVLRYHLNSATGEFLSETPNRFGKFPGIYPNGNLTQGLCLPTRRAICEPNQVSVDPLNRLWVTDLYLRRVTRWDNAVHPNITNPRPSQVYGVTSWTDDRSGKVQTNITSFVFTAPWAAVYQESADALWVLDYLGSTDSDTINGNARLLRFDGVSTRYVFAGAADAYFGVISFTEFPFLVLNPTAYNFFPSYITLDQIHGTLFLSDDARNRVLVFKNAASKPSGSPADIVIGQPDFNTSFSDASRTGLNSPEGLAYDPTNDILYIADTGNNRVVGIVAVTVLTNQPSFTYLIGQSSYTSKSANRGNDSPSANSLSSPFDVSFVAATNTLYVADSGNGRVLSYKCAVDISPTVSPSLAASPAFGTTGGTTGLFAFKRFRQRRQYF